MPKQSKPFAFINLDFVTFRENVLEELLMELFGIAQPSSAILLKIFELRRAWKRAQTQDRYLAEIERLVQAYSEFTLGVTQEVLDKAIQRLHDQLPDLRYRHGPDIIRQYRNTHHLMAFSDLPIEIVRPLSVDLGFKHYHGPRLEIKDGRSTGKVITSEPRKQDVFARYLSTTPDALKDSVGIGSNEEDLVMLSAVGKRIAFNPDSTLLRHAVIYGWPVIEERAKRALEVERGCDNIHTTGEGLIVWKVSDRSTGR